MESTEMAIVELDQRYSALRLACPETEAGLRRSLERDGMREGVVVSAGVQEGAHVLLDGFKRVRVAQSLGWERVPVRVVRVGVGGSHALILSMNRPRRGLREVEEGWLVRSLVRSEGLTQGEVAEILGRHKSWVCRRLKLVEQLIDEVQEQVRLGLVPASTARELVRLPRGNQLLGALAVAEHHLSSREAASLVSGFLKADGTVRLTLLDDPMSWVRGGEAEGDASGAPAPDPRLSKAGNRLREKSYWLERSSREVRGACQGVAGNWAGLAR